MKPTKHIAPFVSEMFSENSVTSSSATGSGAPVSAPETTSNQAAPAFSMWCCKLVTGSKSSTGGVTDVRPPIKARNGLAVRFELQSSPTGFGVYRELNLLGSPSQYT